MNRERKYGLALTVIGGLTLPFFLGIPLLAIGILLLAKGDRLRAEPWIRVLFWIALAALAVFPALLVIDPMKESRHSSEGGMAWAFLLAAPVCVAILVSLAMAGLTLARFPSLSRKDRIMGLGFGSLCVLGGGIALVVAFPGQVLGVAVLSAIVWACVAWRRRWRARRNEDLRTPVAKVAEPMLAAPPPAAPLPVAKPQKPPRTRKPVCGVWAWLLPLLAVPIGILLGWLANQRNYEGFEAWAILGWAAAPVMLGLSVSPILAIASLWRRERLPGLPVVLLVLYGIPLVLFGFELACEAFGDVGMLVILIAGVAIPAAGLIWRRRTNRATSGLHTAQVSGPR